MEIEDDLGTVDVVFEQLAADTSRDHGHSVFLTHAHPRLQNLESAVCGCAVEKHVDVLGAVVDGSVLQFLGVFHSDIRKGIRHAGII